MQKKLTTCFDRDPPALRDVSLRVAAVNGVNLGQGVCLLPMPDLLAEAANEAIAAGHNRYVAPQGIPELRSALAEKLQSFNAIPCSEENVLVTPGATGAFEVICSAFLEAGDEIISFKPFYPYHYNPLTTRNITVRYVDLQAPDWKFDFDQLAQSFSQKTKFLLLCTPNNPTGKVFTRSELEQIADLCRRHNVFCVTDEVYEYMTYDGHQHLSMASLPGMADHTITMGSYSKTFAITGWRIGYLAAPKSVMNALKTACDQIYVCAPAPLQWAVAKGIRELKPAYYDQLLEDYTRKRDLMEAALRQANFDFKRIEGSYYIFADTRKRFPGRASEEVVDTLIEKVGVGAVPASDFLGPEVKGDPNRSTFLRFCYAVEDELLVEAGKRLDRL